MSISNASLPLTYTDPRRSLSRLLQRTFVAYHRRGWVVRIAKAPGVPFSMRLARPPSYSIAATGLKKPARLDSNAISTERAVGPSWLGAGYRSANRINGISYWRPPRANTRPNLGIAGLLLRSGKPANALLLDSIMSPTLVSTLAQRNDYGHVWQQTARSPRPAGSNSGLQRSRYGLVACRKRSPTPGLQNSRMLMSKLQNAPVWESLSHNSDKQAAPLHDHLRLSTTSHPAKVLGVKASILGDMAAMLPQRFLNISSLTGRTAILRSRRPVQVAERNQHINAVYQNKVSAMLGSGILSLDVSLQTQPNSPAMPNIGIDRASAREPTEPGRQVRKGFGSGSLYLDGPTLGGWLLKHLTGEFVRPNIGLTDVDLHATPPYSVPQICALS